MVQNGDHTIHGRCGVVDSDRDGFEGVEDGLGVASDGGHDRRNRCGSMAGCNTELASARHGYEKAH